MVGGRHFGSKLVNFGQNENLSVHKCTVPCQFGIANFMITSYKFLTLQLKQLTAQAKTLRTVQQTVQNLHRRPNPQRGVE